mmetsp:Transcript_62076/g.175030  ORF Transcript_62076/g.175030 Transcript_62076/m.175030 type:complete len:252 (-) Transcript_62076:23-778(-)
MSRARRMIGVAEVPEVPAMRMLSCVQGLVVVEPSVLRCGGPCLAGTAGCLGHHKLLHLRSRLSSFSSDFPKAVLKAVEGDRVLLLLLVLGEGQVDIGVGELGVDELAVLAELREVAALETPVFAQERVVHLLEGDPEAGVVAVGADRRALREPLVAPRRGSAGRVLLLVAVVDELLKGDFLVAARHPIEQRPAVPVVHFVPALVQELIKLVEAEDTIAVRVHLPELFLYLLLLLLAAGHGGAAGRISSARN